ncbi:MAG: adenylyl-sulfate kinase [Bacteroidales bacterium]|nr:adenylyl-sulfate kinase [Bacteroidales bacterium]
MNKADNIFPDIVRMIDRGAKEKLLKQKAMVIWLTGLSGAGKTTIAINLEKELYHKGYLTQILDGDNIRGGINSDLDFSTAGRYENIRRIAEISKLLIDSGVIVICCFISPTNLLRNMAKNIIETDNYKEIFIKSPIDVCEKRDVKGLYKKVREGKIKQFTGIDDIYEEPQQADLIIDSSNITIEESVKKLLDFVLQIQDLNK